MKTYPQNNLFYGIFSLVPFIYNRGKQLLLGGNTKAPAAAKVINIGHLALKKTTGTVLNPVRAIVGKVVSPIVPPTAPPQMAPLNQIGMLFSHFFPALVASEAISKFKLLLPLLPLLPLISSNIVDKEVHEIQVLIPAGTSPVSYKIDFGHGDAEVNLNFTVEAGKPLMFPKNQKTDYISSNEFPPLYPSSSLKQRYTTCNVIITDPSITKPAVHIIQATGQDLIRIVHCSHVDENFPFGLLDEEVKKGNTDEIDVLQKTVISVNDNVKQSSKEIKIPCDPKSYVRITQNKLRDEEPTISDDELSNDGTNYSLDEALERFPY